MQQSTITADQQQAIRDYLKDRPIPAGMSLVIGKWIIRVQDAMPDAMRNSLAWRELLPLAAGTGRNPDVEHARAALILKWMWETVLPTLQSIADKHGFGDAWRTMLRDRAAEAAAASWAAAAASWAAAAAAEASWAAAAAAEASWNTFDPPRLLRQLIEVRSA